MAVVERDGATVVEPLWRIELLVWLRLVGADRVIDRFRTQKVAALLAYMAYHARRSHPREELIELLWPGCEPHAGRVNLRTALASLRRQLEPPGLAPGTVLLAGRDCIGLNPAQCETDTDQFEAALRNAARTDDPAVRAQQRLTAAELYRGDLLPGFFEDWILTEHQRLLEAYLGLLDDLSGGSEAAGDRTGALQWARRAVGTDPLREEARRRLIRLLSATGLPEAALCQYRALERLLREELGAAPEAALRALARELEAQVAATHRVDGPVSGRDAPLAGERSSAPAPASATMRPATPASLPSRPQGALPARFTRFFGREREIALLEALLLRERGDGDGEALGAGADPTDQTGNPIAQPTTLLAPRARLVTLTGPGGVRSRHLRAAGAAQKPV
jgi:DNA-binding SARP family transcriptional activator